MDNNDNLGGYGLTLKPIGAVFGFDNDYNFRFDFNFDFDFEESLPTEEL